jgi:hypothetical protein
MQKRAKILEIPEFGFGNIDFYWKKIRKVDVVGVQNSVPMVSKKFKSSCFKETYMPFGSSSFC